MGTIGHVAHGKSTVVKAISGVQTVRFKNELERNITIKLERLQFDENGEVIIPWDSVKSTRTNGAVKRKRVEEANGHAKRRKLLVKDRNGVKTVFVKEYVVEDILEYKFKSSRHQFLVKWEGWDVETSTWEPIQHLDHAQDILEKFLCKFIKEKASDIETLLNVSNVEKSLKQHVENKGILNVPQKLESLKGLLDLLYKPKKDGDLKIGAEAFYDYLAMEERAVQIKRLKEWEDEINKIAEEKAIIKIENNVDLEFPPKDFQYINTSIFSKDIIPLDVPPRSCKCEPCNGHNHSCCGTQHIETTSFFYYQYKSKRMNMPPGVSIYECNKNCECDSTCANRVLQNGRQVPLAIFRTSNGTGWGVKTLKMITRGEFICEYVGEVITHEEAERRGQVYDARGRTYLFDLDYNSSDNPYTIDAAKYGNVSHFINHSCEPNIGVWAVWVDCLDPNLPRLGLYALRTIMKDQEITFDYRMNNGDPKSPNRQKLIEENRASMKKILCKCDAKKCRKYLFS